MVLHALVDDVTAGRKFADAVGGAAERRFERGGADVALLPVFISALPPRLGQHGQLADDLRQFAVAGRVEGEGNFAIAGLFGLGDVAVIRGLLGTVFLVGVVGKN